MINWLIIDYFCSNKKKLKIKNLKSVLPTCKVEVYGVQREFETETCKTESTVPFEPHMPLLYTLEA